MGPRGTSADQVLVKTLVVGVIDRLHTVNADRAYLVLSLFARALPLCECNFHYYFWYRFEAGGSNRACREARSGSCPQATSSGLRRVWDRPSTVRFILAGV